MQMRSVLHTKGIRFEFFLYIAGSAILLQHVTIFDLGIIEIDFRSLFSLFTAPVCVLLFLARRLTSHIRNLFIFFLLLLISLLIGLILRGFSFAFIPALTDFIFLMSALVIASHTAAHWNRLTAWMLARVTVCCLVTLVLQLLISNGPTKLVSYLSLALTFDFSAYEHMTRQIFYSNRFISGVAVRDVVNLQNVVSQNICQFIVLISVLLLLLKRSPKVPVLLITACLSIMFFIALPNRSGQALQGIFIFIFFCFLSIFLRRLEVPLGRSSSLISLAFRSLIMFGALVILYTLIFVENPIRSIFLERIASGDFTTGRLNRLAFYLDSGGDFNPFTGFNDGAVIDPHNLWVSGLVEGGILGVSSATMIFVYLFSMSARLLSRTSIELFGSMGAFAAASVPLQISFAALVSGGWGFPGGSEVFKLVPVFTALLLLHRQKPYAP
jgi:hypothetical protein